MGIGGQLRLAGRHTCPIALLFDYHLSVVGVVREEDVERTDIHWGLLVAGESGLDYGWRK
jgi:hypothetical protein